jgi:hypothetical protein
VWITLSVRERVMFSMDGNPLLAALSGREPEHRPKHDVRDGVHYERPMCEGPMQVDRRRKNGDLGHLHRDKGRDPDLG